MCGIAGLWNLGSTRVELPDARVERMMHPMSARGPDDRGTWSAPDNNLALGHCRLSILDLSSAGHQPMVSEDGRCVIVYNGEVYNFRELRQELEDLGLRFRSGTDTEVVLAAYRRFGPDCLSRFIGMFAFAIWDGDHNVLFLARDRFGVKPLHYYWKGGLFLFASEIKGIRGYGGLSLTPNRQAMERYFHLTYIPSPDTAFEEITRLDAGHYLLFNGKTPTLNRWYDLAPPYRLPKIRGIKEGEEFLRERLEEAVRCRMIADVPVGVFLSGGLDSAIVTALATRTSDRRVRTYTVGYCDAPLYDESAAARETAAFLGTEHTEVMISVREGLTVVPEVLDYLDEPFGDSSAIPTFLVSRETRQSVKVALSGDGGDEVFAGYSKYQAESFAPMFHIVPSFARRAIRSSMAGLPEGRQSALHEFLRKAKKVVRAAEPDPTMRHYLMMIPLAPEEMKILFPRSRSPKAILEKVECLRERVPSCRIDKTLFADIHLCLKDDMLVKVDLMGMANSLEVRNPFLDHRVVELAARMPGSWKLRWGQRKRILYSGFKKMLPPLIRSRPKKGFGIPVGEWLRADLRGLFEETVSRRNVERSGIIRFDPLMGLFRSHLEGKRDATPFLWSVFVFQWWANRYM